MIHDMSQFYNNMQADPEAPGKVEKIYDYSLALGYAGEVTNGLKMGLSVKYGRQNFLYTAVHAVLFSGGLNYQPAVFDKKINLGFSLMNMGTPVEHESTIYTGTRDNPQIFKIKSEEPVSSKMHLAVSGTPFENDYFSTTVQLGIAKILVNNEQDDSKSSFSALFKDWKDFPRDASLNTGLAFEWKPLDLGSNLSFRQKFYLGSVSFGPKGGSNSVFTHGAEIGIGFREFSFLAGYSGWWHSVGPYSPEFPVETFQFSLEWDINKYLNRSSENKTPSALKNIEISFGSGYNFRKGQLVSSYNDNFYLKSRDGLSYSFESAFYMNRNNALVAAIYYSSIPIELEFKSLYGSFQFKSKYETFGIFSAYRYHPLEVFPSIYVQGGPGIVRINPVLPSTPKYRYQTSLNMAMGANLDMLNNNIIITPELNYQLMLVPINPNSSAPRLGGENQMALAVKLGYRF